MDTAAKQALARLLTREVLKENLATAGLYLIAWEFLQDAIIGQPKGFFSLGSKERYREVVLALYPESPLIASCMWFQDSGVLTAEDVNEIRQIRKHRTDIAHEMPNVLLDPETQVDEAKLMRIYELLSKIDRWWITEVEIPCNEQYDGQTINAGEVKSLRVMFLELLIDSVYGVPTVQ